MIQTKNNVTLDFHDMGGEIYDMVLGYFIFKKVRFYTIAERGPFKKRTLTISINLVDHVLEFGLSRVLTQ